MHDTVAATRRDLEAALQLALWLSKPKLDAPAPDPADGDDCMMVVVGGGGGGGKDQHNNHLGDSVSASVRERRARMKASLTMAERLRRGMRGGARAGGVDLTPVLAYFVQERIAVPA